MECEAADMHLGLLAAAAVSCKRLNHLAVDCEALAAAVPQRDAAQYSMGKSGSGKYFLRAPCNLIIARLWIYGVFTPHS